MCFPSKYAFLLLLLLDSVKVSTLYYMMLSGCALIDSKIIVENFTLTSQELKMSEAVDERILVKWIWHQNDGGKKRSIKRSVF